MRKSERAVRLGAVLLRGVDMSRDFSRAFYSSEAWNKCREAYKHFRGGLCERCVMNGRIEPGVIVHHKIELTPENINDPRVSLSFENLQLLCRRCHAEVHGAQIKRYAVAPDGKVMIV